MAGSSKWRNFLEKFHVYGGLFSVGFLIVFSISAFYHQHHPKFPRPGEKTRLWEATLMLPEISDNLTFKRAVRDSLGLFGHVPWWEDYRDSLGIHHFMITIHFWYIRSIRKRKNWIMAGALASFPMILLIFIWLVG